LEPIADKPAASHQRTLAITVSPPRPPLELASPPFLPESGSLASVKVIRIAGA